MKRFAFCVVVFVTLLFTFCAIQELQAQTTWTGTVTATSDNVSASAVVLNFGVSPTATDGFDSGIDKQSPPAPPEPIVLDSYFPLNHPFIKRLSKDIRQTTDTESWNLRCRADVDGFTLTWDVSGIPATLLVKLDIGGGTIIDMRTASSHHFSAGTYNNLMIMVEPAPFVEVTEPTSATKIKGGDNYTIKWNVGGTGIDHFRIQYLVSGGIPIEIGTTASSIREYLWTTPNNVNSLQVQAKVTAEDASNGSLASDESDNFMIDGTAPVTSISMNPSSPNGDNDWYTSNVEVTLTATDNLSGVDKTYYRINGGAWQEYTAPFTVTGTTVDFYSKDKVGNEETPFKSQLIKIDKTPPTTPSNVTDEGTTYSQDTLNAQWDASADPESLIKEYWYCIGTTKGGNDVRDWTSVSNATEVEATGLNLEEGKTYYFGVKAKNFAGLVSGVGTSNGVTVVKSNLDVTNPTSGETYKGGSVVSVKWTYDGPIADHFRIQYSVNGGAFQPIGTVPASSLEYQWTTSAIDSSAVKVNVRAEKANNDAIASGNSDNFMIDSTPPVTTIILPPPDGENGWYVSNVLVTLNAADNLSGVDKTYYIINGGLQQEYTVPFTVTGSTVQYWSTDKVGNEEGKNSQEIHIDKTPPTAPSNVTDDGDTTYSKTQLHAEWDASSDPESLVKEYFYCIGTTKGGNDVRNWTSVGSVTEINAAGLNLTEDTTYYFGVKAKNFAGLASGVGTSDGIKVIPTNLAVTDPNGGDKIKGGGTVDVKWTYGGPPSDHFRAQYTVGGGAPQNIGTASSASSKISWTTPKIDSSAVRVKVTAEDAGNNPIMAGESDSFTIDSTPPVTTIDLAGTLGDNGWYTGDVTVTLTATDNLSGVDKTYYRINSGAWQEYTAPFTVTGTTVEWYSTDKAGNAEDYTKNSKNINIEKLDLSKKPVVIDDGTVTGLKTQLHAIWTYSPPSSGVIEYQYCIGTTAGGSDIKDWTSVGTDTYATATGLNLTVGTTYYFSVKAKNGTGEWSGIGTSDGIKVVDAVTITAIAGQGGSISPSGSVLVNVSTNQTFTIYPLRGYSIYRVKVDGVSVGAVKTYTFSNVTSAHTIEATFKKIIHTISPFAGAGGTISPSRTVDVEYDDDEKFIMTPSTGYRIDDVKVDGISVGAVTEYTFRRVREDHKIDATFAAISYTITATAGTGGTISPSGSVKVNYSTNQTFAIAPSEGYRINDVKVDGQSVGAVTSYIFTNVTADHTIDATFVLAFCNLTATAGNGGSITPSGTTSVIYGEDQSFTITPDNGYHIIDVKVDGQSVGAVPTYSFTNITANHTIEANFAINTYTLTVSATGGGTISPSGSLVVNHGANQTYTIIPSVWHHIVSVKVDGQSVGAVPTYSFTNVTTNHTIEATFAIDTRTINATVGSGGTVSPSGSVTVDYGSNQTFTINPSDGYHIVDARVDGQSVGIVTTYTFTNVTANHTLEATFEINTYTLIASADAGGKINPSGSMVVNHGTTQKYTITPDEGYSIASIIVDGASDDHLRYLHIHEYSV